MTGPSSAFLQGREPVLSANEILMNEHRDVERFLCVLDAAVGKLQQNEELPASLWERVADFVQGFAVDCHQAKEEKLLLPLLEQRGVPRQGPVGAVLREHEAVCRCVEALTAAVRCIPMTAAVPILSSQTPTILRLSSGGT
jgi:hemerythrin-like domain-containing protein